MRNTIRLLACIGACATLLASPTRANAAPVDVGALWAAPTHLQSLELRFGEFVGYVDAYRTGAGAGSATICLDLLRHTSLPGGATRVDFMNGCRANAKNSAYVFEPARWKGTLSVSVGLRRGSFVDGPDGTIVRGPETVERALMKLRWTGVDDANLRPSIRRTYATFRPVILGLRAKKNATVSGTIAIGRDVVTVDRVKGTMEIGGEAP